MYKLDHLSVIIPEKRFLIPMSLTFAADEFSQIFAAACSFALSSERLTTNKVYNYLKNVKVISDKARFK